MLTSGLSSLNEAGCAPDGPAVLPGHNFAVNGLRDREIGLREVRPGIGEFGGGVRLVGARRPPQLQFAQDEIAVRFVPAGAELWQALIRQCFEHDTSDVGQR